MKQGLIVLAVVALAACAAPVPTGGPPTATSAPSPTQGLAWQLVAAGDRPAQFAYSVRAAQSEAEWSALWTEISPGLDEPAIDFTSNIATVFFDGTGGPGNCSERRLDGIVIDQASGTVYSRISDPLGPRNCDAMLGGSSMFVVAINRSVLPPSPFTLQLARDPTCGDCPDKITVELH